MALTTLPDGLGEAVAAVGDRQIADGDAGAATATLA